MEKEIYKHANAFNDGKWNLKLLREIGQNVSDELLSNISGFHVEKKSKNEKLNIEKMKKKIFISHSSKDEQIVSAFCDLILNNGLGINLSEDVFNTSLDGSKPKSGEDFRLKIQDELKNAKVIIQFISKNYKKSEVCLNEMGAAWVLNSKVVPLIIEPDEYDVGFINSTTQQIQLNDKKQILKFVQDHKESFLPLNFDLARLSSKVDEFEKVYKKKMKRSKSAKFGSNRIGIKINDFSEGAQVNHIQRIEGSYKELPEEYTLVPIVASSNMVFFYPQTIDIERDKKRWATNAHFGLQESIGLQNYFILALARKTIEPLINHYKDVGNKTGEWIPFKNLFNSDFEECIKIKVTRI